MIPVLEVPGLLYSLLSSSTYSIQLADGSVVRALARLQISSLLYLLTLESFSLQHSYSSHLINHPYGSSVVTVTGSRLLT